MMNHTSILSDSNAPVLDERYLSGSGTKLVASPGSTSVPQAAHRRATYSVGVMPVNALKSRMAWGWSKYPAPTASQDQRTGRRASI